MHNSAYISGKRPLTKVLSYSIIILSLFTLSPIANSHPVTRPGITTELVYQAKEKACLRYSILFRSPFFFIPSYNYESAIISYNSVITVRHAKNKVLFHFIDQRKQLKYFISKPFSHQFLQEQELRLS